MESLNSKDQNTNYSSLAIGTFEERKMWNYQVKRLVCLCSFILAECDVSSGEDIAALMSLAVHLMITLSDLKGWRCIDKDHIDAIKAVKELVSFMGSDKSTLYKSIGRFISTLNASFLSLGKSASQPDGRFLIIAGVITLALRPFQAAINVDITESISTDIHTAVFQYFVICSL